MEANKTIRATLQQIIDKKDETIRIKVILINGVFGQFPCYYSLTNKSLIELTEDVFIFHDEGGDVTNVTPLSSILAIEWWVEDKQLEKPKKKWGFFK